MKFIIGGVVCATCIVLVTGPFAFAQITLDELMSNKTRVRELGAVSAALAKVANKALSLKPLSVRDKSRLVEGISANAYVSYATYYLAESSH